MKKSLCLLMLLFSLSIYARTIEGSSGDNKPVNIELEKGNPDKRDTYPRTLVPITCVYADGVVQLSLWGDLGEYTLTVTNETMGECWSAENILLLQTSTASGTYQVEIEVEDGTVYYGTYTL